MRLRAWPQKAFSNRVWAPLPCRSANNELPGRQMALSRGPGPRRFGIFWSSTEPESGEPGPMNFRILSSFEPEKFRVSADVGSEAGASRAERFGSLLRLFESWMFSFSGIVLMAKFRFLTPAEPKKFGFLSSSEASRHSRISPSGNDTNRVPRKRRPKSAGPSPDPPFRAEKPGKI